jgi:hypothetical protein
MSGYDVSFGAETGDVAALIRDEALVESLRGSLVDGPAVGEPADAAIALLLALQQDVSVGLPVADGLLPPEVAGPVGRRRSFGRSATVAAVTVGVLSLAGAAAAATASPGDPLYGLRVAVSDLVSAVGDAVGDVVGGIAPTQLAQPSAASSPLASVAASTAPSVASPSGPAPAPAVVGAEPSSEQAAVNGSPGPARAAQLVELRLDRAERLLDQRRYAGARDELAQARRDLAGVADPGRHASLQDRLRRLQDRLAAETATPPKDGASGTAPGGRPADDGTTGDGTQPDDVPNRDSGPAGDGSGADQTARPDGAGVPTEPSPSEGGSPPSGADGLSAPAGTAPNQPAQDQPGGRSPVEQSSSADLGAAG